MNAREDWLRARKTGLGGSDIAAILGLSPWRTAVDVWMDKTGRMPDAPANEAMHWGTVLEDVVAKHYAETNDTKVQRIDQMLRHPEHDWMIGNIDRAVVQDGSRARFDGNRLLGADGLLEVKTASAYKADEWAGDSLPVYYTAQVMHYMAITGAQWCDVAVLIGGNHYEQRRVEYDADTMQAIIERCAEFWQRHVVEGIQPEPASAADVTKLYQKDSGNSMEADADLLGLIIQAKDLRSTIKADETALEALTDAIKLRMTDASTVTIQGAPILTWKSAKDSRKTNWKAVAEDLKGWMIDNEIEGGVDAVRDIIDCLTDTVPGSRRMLWKD